MANTDQQHDNSQIDSSMDSLIPADVTVHQVSQSINPSVDFEKDCCLVQIYPPDVIDGMMLLEEETIRIGRDFECDLSIEDGNVSRRHAEVCRCETGHKIYDLGSTNGTFVNGKRVSEQVLVSGDRIAVGSFIFKYLSAGCIETHYHEAVYSSLTRDALTGAFNKRYLLESLQREIARSRREKSPLAVVMMDIDRFKNTNDTHGHLVGDQVLREFGQRLLSLCREDDLFARYGGEEFCLLLASTSPEQAATIAERCRNEIAQTPFTTEAGPLQITASFGGECFPGDTRKKPNELIAAADARLYVAKKSGRNRVVIVD